MFDSAVVRASAWPGAFARPRRGQRACTIVDRARAPPEFRQVEYARNNGIDLLVVGTHGRGALSHLIMGSVADRVVRMAPCPVLKDLPDFSPATVNLPRLGGRPSAESPVNLVPPVWPLRCNSAGMGPSVRIARPVEWLRR
jgi:hypothetical protein